MTAIQDGQFHGMGVASGAALSEAIGGIVAIVLTILGLAHVSPTLLVAIATIAIGVALVLQGGALAGEYARLLVRPGQRQALFADFSGGASWSIELLAGAAGIVLGILALLQVASADLVAIAVIGFGGALVLSCNSSAHLSLAKMMSLGLDQPAQQVAGGVLSGSVGVQAVAGLTAIVLGILALAGFSAVVLVLIALLNLGSFILVNGTALNGTLLAMFKG